MDSIEIDDGNRQSDTAGEALAADAGSDALPDGSAEMPSGPAERPGLAPLAGSALASLGGLAGLAVGWDVFAPGGTASGRALAYALWVPFYLVGLRGTLWLYDDASAVARSHVNWRPNPWSYLGGGGAALAAALLLAAGVPATPLDEFLAVAFGALVVATPIGSVAAAPLYLLRRRRFIDGS